MKRILRIMTGALLTLVLSVGLTPVSSPPDAISTSAEQRAAYDQFFSIPGRFEWDAIGGTDAKIWRDEFGTLVVLNVDAVSRKQIAVNVTDTFYTSDCTYYVVGGTDVYWSANDGSVQKLVYRSDSGVTKIIGNMDLLFFSEDGIIKRLHLQSGIVDALHADDAVLFRPYNNDSLLLIDEGPAFEQGGDWYPMSFTYRYYDCSKNACQPLPDDYLSVFDKGHTAYYPATSSSFVYPAQWAPGRHYNDSNTSPSASTYACTHHNNCSVDGSCFCKAYYHNRKGWAIQCMGFSRMIHNLWHGYDYTASQEMWRNIYTTPQTFMAIPTGSWVNTCPEHSWIMYSKSATTFTVYEANFSGPCLIGMRTLTYDEAPTCFPYLYYYTVPI